MNKQILATVFFFLMLSFNMDAQIAVSSFESANQDMTARVTNSILDQNGDKCALIKIRTTQKGFVFEGDMLGITSTIQKTGEIWLYVPAHARKLTIKHEHLGVLDNYLYPENIQEASVYIMELKTGDVKIIVQNQSISKEWVVIESDPPGATVYINNEMQTSLTPFSKKLDLGKYTYRIEYKDFHSDAGSFDLLAKKKQNLNIILKPAFGSLSINTSPDQGATILIDNLPIGKNTPYTIEKLSSGKHDIRVMKDLFEIAMQEVEIIDGQEAKVNIAMIPKYGEIEISTNPPSDIYIDGEYISNNTYKGRLAIGSHTIESRLKHHYNDTKGIQISSGDKIEIDLKAQAKTGSIDIITKPIGAKIFIDDEYRDETPATIRDLLEGEHAIRLNMEGFASIFKTVTINENNTIELNEEFQKSMNYSTQQSESSYSTSRSLKNTFIDPRDKQEYKIVIIGKQTWFAENLNYKRDKSWCYDNKEENCSKYGRLYTWNAAMNACPIGWRLPSDEEWKELETFLGMSQNELEKSTERGTDEGEKMKSTSGWNNGNGINSSRFNALPGGYHGSGGLYEGLGDSGDWWSSSELSGLRALGRSLTYEDDQVRRYSYNKTPGFSVRCLKK